MEAVSVINIISGRLGCYSLGVTRWPVAESDEALPCSAIYGDETAPLSRALGIHAFKHLIVSLIVFKRLTN